MVHIDLSAHSDLVKQIAQRVHDHLVDAEGGHDWSHIERVWKNAMSIADEEKVNREVVALATLLHDIADPKFHNGDEEIGPRIAGDWLVEFGCTLQVIEHIKAIIKNMSYKNSLEGKTWTSPELKVVQDADRLDAIGAIGIARAFNYGGFKDRSLYDPAISPKLNMTKEEYKKNTAPTINHFYEKLLLLKDLMNTDKGKELAEQRHQFMKTYLDQFYDECGKPDWDHS